MFAWSHFRSPLTLAPLIWGNFKTVFLAASRRAMNPKAVEAGWGEAQPLIKWSFPKADGKIRMERDETGQKYDPWKRLDLNSDATFRSAAGRRRLCCICTCSRGLWEWPIGERGRQLAGAGRSRQRCPPPGRRPQKQQEINKQAQKQL